MDTKSRQLRWRPAHVVRAWTDLEVVDFNQPRHTFIRVGQGCLDLTLHRARDCVILEHRIRPWSSRATSARFVVILKT